MPEDDLIMVRSIVKKSFIVLIVTLGVGFQVYGQETKSNKGCSLSDSTKARHENLLKSLDESNGIRRALQDGSYGCGPRQDWMDEMASVGIKQANFVFIMKTKKGVRRLSLRGVSYTAQYANFSQALSQDTLDKMKQTGLDRTLRHVAETRAASIVINLYSKHSFKCGVLNVNLYDDETFPDIQFMNDLDIGC